MSYIQELLGLNLIQDSSYPDCLAELFHGFTQPFQENAKISLQLGQNHFLQNPF
jgi:hypothetical protein